MIRLQSALDNEIHIAIQRFISDGVPPDVTSLYNAIQRSNSSLKRKPKKLLQSSIERVLEFMGAGHDSDDSEAAIERIQAHAPRDDDLMNRSLRANLTPVAPSPPVVTDDIHRKRARMANGEPVPKKQKPDGPSTRPPQDICLEDIGGMDEVMLRLEELLVRPLLAPEEYEAMHIKVPNGILLHGPPGCGKTMLSRAFAAAMEVPFVEILGPSIVSGMSGESEKAIRERFDEAKRLAPCLVYMDEIDAIAPKRETSQSQMEKRIVAQLLVSMDEIQRDTSKPVIVLATTNRPDSIDPALRRGGRFDTEINIGVPNESVRELILEAQTREAPLAKDVDFKRLARMTAGFVGADLHDLVSKAGSWQLTRYFDACKAQVLDMNGDLGIIDSRKKTPQSIRRMISRLRQKEMQRPPGFEDRSISMEAFLAVLPSITPSSKREGFATIPDVSWNDIGALEQVRDELQRAIVEPIKHPEIYRSMGVTATAGVLLWGPPGCGKTLLAKAAAAESKANFISVKGPELLNKFVGESEAAVRRLFMRARSSAPCVIFFDELDALVPRRDEGGGSEASARVVNTLLTELDGLDDRAGIYAIAATNRPEMIDEAMLRPGRLGTPLFVDLPGPSERAEILRTLLRSKPVENISEIISLAETSCNGYSGADLEALWRQACDHAIRRRSQVVEFNDFRFATTKIRGSVGNMERYYKLKAKFGHR